MTQTARAEARAVAVVARGLSQRTSAGVRIVDLNLVEQDDVENGFYFLCRNDAEKKQIEDPHLFPTGWPTKQRPPRTAVNGILNRIGRPRPDAFRDILDRMLVAFATIASAAGTNGR